MNLKNYFPTITLFATLLVLQGPGGAAAEEVPAVKAYSDIPLSVLAAYHGILNLRNPPPNETCSAVTLDGKQVLTAGHCLLDREKKPLDLKNTGLFLGDSMMAFAPKILRLDVSLDLALLEPRARQRPQRAWTTISIADSRAIKFGDELFVVGLRTGIRRARVVVPPGKGAFFELEPTQAEEIICEPGDSGGAVVDDHGNVVGIISGNLARTGRSQLCEVISREHIVKFISGGVAARLSPEDLAPEQDVLYGGYELRVGNYERATRFYTHAARRDEGALRGNLGLCALQKIKGSFSGALAYCRKANNVQPSDLGAMTMLSEVYFDLERLDEANEFANRIVASAPKDADAHIRLGMILKKRGLVNAAMAEYLKALELAHLDEASLINAYGGMISCTENLQDYRATWRYIHRAKHDGVYVGSEVTDWLRERMPEPADEDD